MGEERCLTETRGLGFESKCARTVIQIFTATDELWVRTKKLCVDGIHPLPCCWYLLGMLCSVHTLLIASRETAAWSRQSLFPLGLLRLWLCLFFIRTPDRHLCRICSAEASAAC